MKKVVLLTIGTHDLQTHARDKKECLALFAGEELHVMSVTITYIEEPGDKVKPLALLLGEIKRDIRATADGHDHDAVVFRVHGGMPGGAAEIFADELRQLGWRSLS
jgi:hypothetical protein